MQRPPGIPGGLFMRTGDYAYCSGPEIRRDIYLIKMY